METTAYLSSGIGSGTVWALCVPFVLGKNHRYTVEQLSEQGRLLGNDAKVLDKKGV